LHAKIYRMAHKYVQEFEIDVRESEQFHKPVMIEPEFTVSESNLRFSDHVEYSVNSMKKYIEKRGKLKEIEFKFTIESIEILAFKRLNKPYHSFPRYYFWFPECICNFII